MSEDHPNKDAIMSSSLRLAMQHIANGRDAEDNQMVMALELAYHYLSDLGKDGGEDAEYVLSVIEEALGSKPC